MVEPCFPASDTGLEAPNHHFLIAMVTPAPRLHPFWHPKAPPGCSGSLLPDLIGLSFDSHPQPPELLLTPKVQKTESPMGPSMDGTSKRPQIMGAPPRSPTAALPPAMSTGLAHPKDATGFLPEALFVRELTLLAISFAAVCGG